MDESVNRLELLTMLYSLEALLDKGDLETAKIVIKKVIAEAEKVRPQD